MKVKTLHKLGKPMSNSMPKRKPNLGTLKTSHVMAGLIPGSTTGRGGKSSSGGGSKRGSKRMY